MADVQVNIDVTTQKAIQNVQKFQASTQQSLNKLTGSIGKLQGLFAGFAVGAFVKKSIDAFDKQEKAIQSVRNGLELTGTASGQTFDKLVADASKLQTTSLFGDEQILNDVTAQFLTFGNIAGEAFDRGQQAALDLSAKLGTDLKGQAIQLAKALDNPIQGVTALSRAGVTFTEQQKKQIKTLQESGDILGAQNVVLTEIEAKYGGAAKAAAEAGAGPLQQLQNRFGDITEVIGKGLIPVITFFGNILGSIAGFIERNNAFFQDFIKFLAILASLIGTVILAIKTWTVVQRVLNTVMKANPIILVISLIAGLVAWIITLVDKYEGWGKAFQTVGVIIKLGWENLKDVFSTGFKFLSLEIDLIVSRFKYLKNIVGNIFGNIGSAIKFAIQGDFSEAKKALFQSVVPDDSEMNKIKKEQQDLVSGFVKRSQARVKAQTELFKSIQLTNKEEAKAGNLGVITPTTNVATSDGTGKAASTTASRAAAKSVTINVDSLIGTSNITQNQDPLILREQIIRALTSLLADSSAFA